MTTIPLGKSGLVALVDDEDAERVGSYLWHAFRSGGNVYAIRRIRVGGYKGPKVCCLMHRFIVSAPDGLDVDHRNHNGLDNRRENLRVCEHVHNMRNMLPHSTGHSSTFKGVGFHKKRAKWRAFIRLNGREEHLGLFVSEIEAARAYDAAALAAWGEFAWLNFPEEAAN